MADKTAPDSRLRLEFVYGYRGHTCRNNVYYTANKDVVYFVAGVGIVYSAREHKQRFFLGHNDDLISLALHPDRTTVATGQIGDAPYICVWDSATTDTISILKDGHKDGIAALGFDKEGNRLVSVGLDAAATINVWDWRKGKIISTATAQVEKIFDVQFSPYKENTVVSAGVKHIAFWQLCGNALTPKKGVFGKVGEIQTLLCLAFGPEDTTYAGTLSGDVYVWKDFNLERVISAAHDGPVYTLDMGEGFASGGKDGSVKLWDMDFKQITAINLASSNTGYAGLVVRAVCWKADQLLVGTQAGEIYEVMVKTRDKPKLLVQGHSEGEMWALATHPKKPIFVSGSDDQTLRQWSMSNCELLSKASLDQKIRACAYDPEGQHIAAGLTDGSFMVLRSRDLSELVHIKDRREACHEVKFSPCGKFLAVGSNDGFVDVYAVDQRYKKLGTCTGSSSFVTHLDWSQDSKHIQINSGTGERLVFRLPAFKQVTQEEELTSIHWATYTGVLGAEVNGIWGKYADTNDVNAADANFDGKVVVTGDDFGMVKVYRFPSLKKGAKFRKYVGHSAHVTNVRFSNDGQRVISIGGEDHAVFQWRFLPTADGDDDLPDHHNAYVDSNSEDSDSDLSDVGDVDSDVEREKQVGYDRALYKEDMSRQKKLLRSSMQPGAKRKNGPADSLKLEYVNGYRGYDCRNNLFYTQTGEVVYHVAATCIVLNRESGKQRFYTEHTDDILCLCIHPMKDIVATGQVGRDPSIHIWDVESLKTGSVLKGQHQRGICALDFSADGKKLASVGLDDNHSIVVWDWKKGEKLATTRGHKDKIFVIKWNPLDHTKLVTVGVKHIKFWTQTGGGFTSNRGTMGQVAKLCDMMCVSYGKAADGHMEGEVWGLAMHPSKAIFVTVGDDKTLRLWDMSDGVSKMINFKVLKQAARCVAFSPDGQALAIGQKDGSFLVVNTESLEEILTQHHRKEEICDIRFSPDPGKYLAVASHDNFVDIYSVLKTKRVGTCKGASSYITHIDWDLRGKVLMVNTGAKEQLFFEAPRGKRITLRSAEVEKFGWASWTCVLGPTCEGIWPPKSDVTDVNATSLADSHLLATGDDFGFVKLFEYPVTGKFAKFKKYMGHSAHVTNVRWSQDNSRLVSTGGADTAVLIWKRETMGGSGKGQGESDDSDTDDEEEGYDSDVAREKNIDYTTKIYVNPMREKAGVKPHLQERESEKQQVSRNAPEPPKVKKAEPPSATGGKKRKMTQVTDLQLDFIYGYRGFDARSNLFYINDGADIVFHAAGAGIVQNLAAGTQSFYLKHTDDIICLDVNQHPKFKNVIATGQIGNIPSVHIWDGVTKETLSIIQGGHSKGICSVDFSCTGKNIVTVGLEDDHNVVVWRWQDGTKVASAPGHSQRIFRAEFRPDSDTQLVSVGVKHVKFWSVAGSELIGKRGILTNTEAMGQPKMQTMLSLAFGANNVTYTGAMSGDVYVWQDSSLARIVQKAHTGPVFTMFTTLRDGLIVTGGKETASKENSPIKLWDQEMKRCKAFPLKENGSKADVVKSVCRAKGKILVGTKDNCILEVAEKTGNVHVLVAGHGEGEVWGLDRHPTAAKFITAGYDGTVRLWDLASKSLVAKLDVTAARSVAFSPDGELIAVGLKTGEFLVLSTTGLKLWGRKRDRAGSINDIRFSPNSKILAVGSDDNCVDFYDLAQGPSLTRAGFCKGIASFIINMDFSADSKYIRVCTGAYINQVYSVPEGSLTQDTAITDKITWATWTSVVGKEVLGIWPKNAENADVNCSHLSHLGNALATGDDFGLVKLFGFPCADKFSEFKKYAGHSAHVTNVRFMFDDRYLVSTGGDDCW
ncbi:echinoderm microtubule-associated protein-like 6 [Plakobranchus ocellatus]|uniref:Echinoderm microtubule-associated protein-like 6 n=1 Tax=Plakobranchus ocellatus TaxID=259542 RepID=A0AAV3ZT08_9GAST|nr:echinoderm microtubule-associated protein-like 6 [Plakobranchus ocellatus]